MILQYVLFVDPVHFRLDSCDYWIRFSKGKALVVLYRRCSLTSFSVFVLAPEIPDTKLLADFSCRFLAQASH